MIRLAFIGAAIVSPFLLPVGVTVFLALLASFWSAAIPFVVGVIVDALYWSPAAGIPYGSLLGAIVSVIVFSVHRYAKASIMYA